MRKRSSYRKQELEGDPTFGRVDVQRFINYLMTHGRKATAEKVFSAALLSIKSKGQDNPVQVFERAIQNTTPVVEVVSRRIGGANYQIPQEVRPERKFFLAAHWIIDAARSGKGRTIAEKLAGELLAAAKNEGSAIKKKLDTHRMAEANRAFASLMRR